MARANGGYTYEDAKQLVEITRAFDDVTLMLFYQWLTEIVRSRKLPLPGEVVRGGPGDL